MAQDLIRKTPVLWYLRRSAPSFSKRTNHNAIRSPAEEGKYTEAVHAVTRVRDGAIHWSSTTINNLGHKKELKGEIRREQQRNRRHKRIVPFTNQINPAAGTTRATSANTSSETIHGYGTAVDCDNSSWHRAQQHTSGPSSNNKRTATWISTILGWRRRQMDTRPSLKLWRKT